MPCPSDFVSVTAGAEDLVALVYGPVVVRCWHDSKWAAETLFRAPDDVLHSSFQLQRHSSLVAGFDGVSLTVQIGYSTLIVAT